MAETPDEITVQCPVCFEMVQTTVSQLKEDRFLTCSHCFSTPEMDVDRIIEGLEKLMKKIQEAKDKKNKN